MIDEKVVLNLNQHPHKCHWRGADASLPILIVIHGGPGVPNRHQVFQRHAVLCDVFMVVTYDQRGSGGSYFGCDPDSLRLEVYLEDLHALVQAVTQRFKQEKVILLGGSWGTELGTLYAFKHPEYVRAYVGYGQVVNGYLNESLSYDFVYQKAKEHNAFEDLRILDEIGPPVKGCYRPVYRGLRKQRNLLMKYGGSSTRHASFYHSTIKPIIASGEYTLRDLIGYLKGIRFSLEHSWASIVDYRFEEDVYQFQVPIYFFQGHHDHNTPSALVTPYFERIEAPHKSLIWFEHSAHGPFNEEPEKFHDCLLRYVLKGDPYEE